MKKMYKGKVNSPATLLVETIDSSVTSIKVADGAVFPEGPNVAVIGTDGNAETIKYESINGNILVGCVRGFQGKASVWDKDTIIARNFTEYDLDALQENILELDKKQLKDFQTDENHRTVTDSEKNKLEKIEDGANKVTKISQLINDKTFKTESEIQSLINNSTKLKKEVVTSLPSSGKEDVIYLLKNKNDTNNYYTEYMWIGGKWEIIGDTKVDLTDYAKKSEIKSSLSEMTSDSTHRTVTDDEKKTWNNKVEKVTGKGLSTNDYTDVAKAKVDNIPTNPKYTDTTYSNATTSSAGLMSAEDKVKLNGLGENSDLKVEVIESDLLKFYKYGKIVVMEIVFPITDNGLGLPSNPIIIPDNVIPNHNIAGTSCLFDASLNYKTTVVTSIDANKHIFSISSFVDSDVIGTYCMGTMIYTID